MEYLEVKYLECHCTSPECVTRFSWVVENDNKDFQELSVQTQLVNSYPWYKRLWYAFQYVVARKHLGWSETLMTMDQVKRLKLIVDEYMSEYEADK